MDCEELFFTDIHGPQRMNILMWESSDLSGIT